MYQLSRPFGHCWGFHMHSYGANVKAEPKVILLSRPPLVWCLSSSEIRLYCVWRGADIIHVYFETVLLLLSRVVNAAWRGTYNDFLSNCWNDVGTQSTCDAIIFYEIALSHVPWINSKIVDDPFQYAIDYFSCNCMNILVKDVLGN